LLIKDKTQRIASEKIDFSAQTCSIRAEFKGYFSRKEALMPKHNSETANIIRLYKNKGSASSRYPKPA
jgi:hypothetical protein